MQLTPKILEALDLLQEECSEIIQIISKIRRFGPDSYHPEDQTQRPNKLLLTDEIGDFEVLVNWLINSGAISEEDIDARMEYKIEKLKKYTNLFKD